MSRDFARSALIEIDVQNDFCPGGALAVADGDAVVSVLNAIAARFAPAGARVIATQDWHPQAHVSFASMHPEKRLYDSLSIEGPSPILQTLWPDHCVQGSDGAGFHPGLDLSPVHLILRKGTTPALDSYSAFFENDRTTPTGLEGYLRGLGLDTVYLGGLATDYCVLYTALDAVRLGFTTIVIGDATRGVGVTPTAIDEAIQRMRGDGVRFIASGELL